MYEPLGKKFLLSRKYKIGKVGRSSWMDSPVDAFANFSFLMDDETGEWRLSPAYDLLFTPGPGSEHTMTLAGEGLNPGRVHFMRLADEAEVSPRDAERIIGEVQASIADWREFAGEVGISRDLVQRISGTLVGLELPHHRSKDSPSS